MGGGVINRQLNDRRKAEGLPNSLRGKNSNTRADRDVGRVLLFLVHKVTTNRMGEWMETGGYEGVLWDDGRRS